MRCTIQSASPPLYQGHWTDLADLHRAFVDALQLLVPPPPPERLARDAGVVSAIYNSFLDEQAAGRPDLSDARLHYFMPTDLAKIWLPFGELAGALELPRRKMISILDLGAGTGTASIGLVMLLAKLGFEGKLSLTLVEPDRTVARLAPAALGALKDVCDLRFRESVRGDDVDGFLRARLPERFDLVLMLDVLTEMFPRDDYVAGVGALATRLLKDKVKRTGFLVLVEPALKKVSELLSQVGTEHARSGGAVYGPCPTGGRCPAIERKGGFCFHSAVVPMSPLLQSVSARCGLARHEVNFSYLSISPSGRMPPAPAFESWGRIVSFPRRVKKGFNYHVCTPGGLSVAFAPRFLADGSTRGGRLKHGTIVKLEGDKIDDIPPANSYNKGEN